MVDTRDPPRLDFLTKIVAINFGNSTNLLAKVTYNAQAAGGTLPDANVTGLQQRFTLWDQSFKSADSQGGSVEVVDPPSKAMMEHLYAWAIPGQVSQTPVVINGASAAVGSASFYFNVGRILTDFGHGTLVELGIAVPQMSVIPGRTVPQYIVFWNEPEEVAAYGPGYPRAPNPPADTDNFYIAILQADGAGPSLQSIADNGMWAILSAGGPQIFPIFSKGDATDAATIASLMNTDGDTFPPGFTPPVFGLVSRFSNPAVTGTISLTQPAIPPEWGVTGVLYTRDPNTGALKSVSNSNSFGSNQFTVQVTVDTKAKTIRVTGPGGDTGFSGGDTGG